MARNLRNTVTVLVLTAFTALAIFATVQLTARVTGISPTISAASAATVQDSGTWGQSTAGQANSGQLMTCPRTGCSETYCHAAQR